MLRIIPCIPEEWELYKIRYRFGNSMYNIIIHQKIGVGENTAKVDGIERTDLNISLNEDVPEHIIEVTIYSGKG